MTITVGDALPAADLMQMGDAGPEKIALSDLTDGRKVVIFGLPGAYTGTCSNEHVPGFIQHAEALRAKGVDDIICVSVNDAFVMKAWAKDTGADAAGLKMLGDPLSTFTKAIGLDFDAPDFGLVGRSLRYAMVVENGKVTALNTEENPGVCDVSGGAAVLAMV